MMENTYRGIEPQFRWMADYLETETKLHYKVYWGGKQIDVIDKKGNIHSYDPTTNTCVLNAGKDIDAKECSSTFYQFIEKVQEIEKEGM